MIRSAAIGFSLLLSSVLTSAPAQAKPGDKAWAQCVWSQAPDSAATWLGMSVPSWQTSYEEASVRLGHKLIAMCDSSAANPMRPNRMPNWKSLAAALRRAQPKATEPITSASAAEVLLCRSSLDEAGREVPFLYEFVRRAAGRETISFQQNYGSAGGQALKLPQDLRMIPQDLSKVKRTCRTIGPKGELLDA